MSLIVLIEASYCSSREREREIHLAFTAERNYYLCLTGLPFGSVQREYCRSLCRSPPGCDQLMKENALGIQTSLFI